ncbi:WW domain-containing oxidoreductase [Exidia glandulosa HHB12029]|uniref:WW domain-containing oxidoreductase n=1 Tax=Exidia glandulosa HHB12029 TaxID=1314781 RepID=A0A165GJS1_EXIGL|nr:WW domain-containing oxidoreductase [Exidia glandulosa HHB12029]
MLNPNFRSETTGEEVVAAFPESVKGRVFLVTGPTPNGIGAATLLALAKAQPHTLILAGRTLSAFKPVADEIRTIGPTIRVVSLQVDLVSLASVRQAAVQLEEDGIEYIDVMINNAGIMATPFGRTVDGYEQQFATNHLGHFLFTSLLLPKLLASRSPRVINLTSSGHRMALGHYDDWNFEKLEYDPGTAYGQSKLANILFTRSLVARYGARGLRAYAVHPGSVATELQRYLTPEREAAREALLNRIANEPNWEDRRRKSPEEGASTTLVAALTPDLEPNGAYLSDCQLGNPKNTVYNAEVERQLWELSERLVGQTFE